MKVLCVLNPLAADGAALKRWPQVAALLGEMGADHEVLADERVPIGEHVLARLGSGGAQSFGAIAGLGGDGTHSAIINAIMQYRVRDPSAHVPPYAFIPLGTGNDMAKSFGLAARDDHLARDMRRAVSTVLHGADYQLDLGLLDGHYFADALTIGLDPHILHERNVRRRALSRIPLLRHILRGQVLYTWCTGIRFWQQDPISCEIRVDGRLWYAGTMINLLVNNTQIYAGEFCFYRNTYANDGKLDVMLFTGHIDYLRKYLLASRHNPDSIQRLSERLNSIASQVQGTEIEVRLSRTEAAQVDGEELPSADTFHVRVVPGAIRVKTPAEPM